MAKIEVRGDSDAGSLYVNGRFIRSFWYKDRADADIIAEKLTQALALPDPSVATAQNSHLPEAKPVDREFLNKYLQTLSGMLATTGVVGPVGENALTVEIRAVLDELRKAIGLPTRPLLVPGYVVPASALVSPPAVDIKIVTIRPKGWYRITLNGVKVGIFGALDLAQKRVDELRQALGLPLEFPVKGAVTVAPATIKPDVGISQNGEDMLVNGFAVVAPEERATRAKEEIMISFSEWQRQFLGSATYQEQRELYQNYVNRVLDKMEGFPLYSRFGLEPQNGVQRDFRIVTLVAEDEKSAKNLGSTSTPSAPNMPKFAAGMVVMYDPQPDSICKYPVLIFDSVFENGEWLYNGNYYEAGLHLLTPLEATGKE